MDVKTKGYKKTKYSSIEIHEMHSRIQFMRPEKKLYFRITLRRTSWIVIGTVETKMVKLCQQDGRHYILRKTPWLSTYQKK